MEKHEVKTKKAPEPVGPYSQAVIAGQFVFCSGQIALDPASGQLITGNIEEETVCVMNNLKEVLKSAGSSLDNVVKTTIYLQNMDDFISVNKVYGSFFSQIPPSRATVQVACLPKNAHVEIDCIALIT
ncbi:MAG: RidA family protein [Candidatus Latescibacteria bacterium]|nr:RidA family protein [Candidatus Latescibacterota bacterium]